MTKHVVKPHSDLSIDHGVAQLKRRESIRARTRQIQYSLCLLSFINKILRRHTEFRCWTLTRNISFGISIALCAPLAPTEIQMMTPLHPPISPISILCSSPFYILKQLRSFQQCHYPFWRVSQLRDGCMSLCCHKCSFLEFAVEILVHSE